MANLDDPRMTALAPLTRRVRRDVTAVKRNGRQAWTDEPLTKLRLAQHLNGGPARGVCPILPGTSTTLVGLYDLDSHGGTTPWDSMAVLGAALVDTLTLVWGCTPVCFRSGGGRGIHVYLVWDEAQQARDVRRWMASVLAGMGLRSGTKGVAFGEVEVFPKQDRVPEGGFGNQFILPLAGASELLVPCDLSGALVPTARPLDASMWQGSPAVPVAPADDAPVVPLRSRPLTESPQGGWLEALDAIPNGRGDGDGQDTSLGYDDWRNVIFAIHYETRGSAEGLELARDWSSRSPKFDDSFLEERVWQYIRPERDHPITGATICRLALTFGWHPTIPDDAFPSVPIDEAQAAVERETWAHTPIMDPDGTASDLGAGGSAAGGLSHVVEAQAVCTDLANAGRVVAASGGQMMTLSGQWYVWDGKRFAPDAPAAMREVCALSKIIKREADEAEATARRLLLSLEGIDAVGADLPKAKEVTKRASKERDTTKIEAIEAAARACAAAESLHGWVKTSEMKPRIDAALKLAADQLAVPAGTLDADPWLVTVSNGTIDLRTGELRGHSPADRITQMVPYDYDPQAEADAWEDVLLQICCGDREMVDFLRRWYGYCLTGHVREQVFLVHFGGGSNGKSLLLDLMQATSGDYACGAPPGLVASTRGDTMKDTELAVLRGRRMVTAHESRAGAELREDLVKLATGDDKISARHLYGSPFDFSPTHKLQLLTNHRPVVRTQDYGTWRRIVLVPYNAKFGTADEVARGEATAVADRMLGEKLRRPEMLRAVLAWRVRGAVEWAHQGLQIPTSVRLSSEEYQSEQDRTAQFLAECCERGAEFTAYLSGGPGLSTVYAEYVSWIREAGGHAVSRQRLLQDLRRLGIEDETQGRAVLLKGLRLVGAS